jgi:hypothetical protein
VRRISKEVNATNCGTADEVRALLVDS